MHPRKGKKINNVSYMIANEYEFSENRIAFMLITYTPYKDLHC